MVEGNGSPYSKLIKGYLKGRIPFRVWMFSSLISSMTMVVYNLVNGEAILQGFFSVLFINLAITIPLFLAQAHFVGLSLQRNPGKAKTTLIIVLIIGWALTGFCISWFLTSAYPAGVNSGTSLMIVHFLLLVFCWIALSLLTFRRGKIAVPHV